MKIGLITIHWANNYGASLQVFATVKTLNKYGDVSVLDYRNSYTGKGMVLIRFGTKLRDILRMSKDFFRLFPRYRVIKKFENFSYKYFNLTSRLKNDNDFKNISKQFDLFVSGSDQIWNPKIISEDEIIDTHYFLDFVVEKKRMSYASSLGSYQYKEEERSKVISLLNSYNSLSVREKDSSEYLGKLLNKNISHVLDPTLLLNKKEWLDALDIQNINEDLEPYILVYALMKDPLLKQVVEGIKEALNLRVITIDQDPFTNFKNDTHIKDAGPDEFVKLFSQASFIVTNSFHGTCFSINFNIPFIVTTPLSSINRIESLLTAVGSQDRITVDGDNLLELIQNQINFNVINQKLQELRLTSNQYLDNVFKKE
ncbi:MAG: polysaccharide pyruvyl transferase family protein [Bacteroidales bacterium]|nr:polysaccharide pyruvyl transferase family protein [Bacteroidales bacterium]